MQTLAGGVGLTAEMTLKNSVLLDVAVALVRIQKSNPEFTRLHSILVCAFALQTVRGYDFAIPTYICATCFAALDPSVLHAASTCPSYRFYLRLVLHLLHDTPFFHRPLPHLAIPSPSEVPRAFLGQSHQAVGRVFHVDGKESRNFAEAA